jgi:hypothetical protein
MGGRVGGGLLGKVVAAGTVGLPAWVSPPSSCWDAQTRLAGKDA